MKKFLSLMLAVLLLVSALPFQAFATDAESADFYIQINVGEEGKASKLFTMPADADEDTAEAYARADEEYAAYFAEYGACTVAQTAPNAFLITFAAATEPEETEPVETEPECEHPDAKLTFKSSTATCGKDGIATYECECGEKVEKNAAATGDHDYEDGVCNVCNDKKDYKLTFVYEGGIKTITVENGDDFNLPSVPAVDGHRIEKWVGNKGDEIRIDYTNKAKFHIGMSDTYEAVYVETNDDGLVDLTIYAYYYVDGEYHHKAQLHVEKFYESRRGNMVPWLYDEGVDVVRAALNKLEGADGYQWNPTKFYNCFTDGEVSHWDDLKTDGNKAVYVKVESKKAIEATILLHIHTAKEYAIARTVKMPGYTKGDFVSYNEVLAKVKNYYTGSNLSMSDLYSESDWEDLMDGLKSSGSKTIKVEDNGTTEIHVIVKNATSKTSSNADTSNPKTGDYITIAVGTMAMAAAALVTLAELKKRKMI